MVWRPGIWVRGNEHRLLAPLNGQKSTLSIVGIEAELPHLVGAGLPAMTTVRTPYDSRASSPASRLLQGTCIFPNDL